MTDLILTLNVRIAIVTSSGEISSQLSWDWCVWVSKVLRARPAYLRKENFLTELWTDV